MTMEPLSIRARLFLAVLGLGILFFVINLVRTRKLKEQYALLWLLMAGFLVITPLASGLVDRLAYAVGVEYPPALLFALALMVFLLIFFQFSLSISRFSEQIKLLSQSLALANERIRALEARLAEREEHHGGTEDTESTEGDCS